jgi:hypothetical protein
MIQQNVLLQPYKPSELADLYNIDVRTFNTWIEPHLEEIGPRQGHYYNVLQVEIIFVLKGWPKVKVQR